MNTLFKPKVDFLSFKGNSNQQNPGYRRENSGKTQISSAVRSYEKMKDYFQSNHSDYKNLDILDYGAGKGEGARVLGAKTYEPFPSQWSPDFRKPEEIKGQYDIVTCNFVLKVIPDQDERKQVIQDVGSHLKQVVKLIL